MIDLIPEFILEFIYEITPDAISKLPVEAIIVLALLLFGLVVSIIKKALKVAILLLVVLIICEIDQRIKSTNSNSKLIIEEMLIKIIS